MYALPRQTLTEAEQDIATAIASGVGHVSAYHLTLEPNTAFHHTPPPLPDDDLAADMQEMVEQKLAAAGFEHYETSAFARPGQRMPAQPQLLDLRRLPGHRRRCPRQAVQPPADLARDASAPSACLPGRGGARRIRVQANTTIAARDLPGEFMMNALRLNEGFPLADCSPSAPACRWPRSKSRRWWHGAQGCWRAPTATCGRPSSDAASSTACCHYFSTIP
jgi:hypothetical protein